MGTLAGRVKQRLGIGRRVYPSAAGGHPSADDEEEDLEREIFRNLWQQRRLLPPSNSPHTRRPQWNQVLMMCMAYEQIYIPLQLAFGKPSAAATGFYLPLGQLLAQYLIDVLFMLDIMANLRTTIRGSREDGSLLITDVSVIWKRYVRPAAPHRGRFVWDVVSCFPLDIFGAAM